MSRPFKALSNQDFAALGAPHVVYIRPVLSDDGATTFAVHAADGQRLAEIDSYEHALIAARERSLRPVSVH